MQVKAEKDPFSEELQTQFRDLEIYIQNKVSDLFSGEFRSYFKGVGLEFEDVREYVYGDDVRSMDWNISARTGRPHVRQFMDRRELSVYFLVDVSASTEFGSLEYSKRYYLTKIFALLASAASHHQNNIGLFCYSDCVEYLRKPVKGQRHVMQMAYELLHLHPQNRGTSLEVALNELHHIRKNRSVVIVLSDFWESIDRESLILANHLHDLIFIRLLDPSEIQLPSAGLFHVQDLESNQAFEMDCFSQKQGDALKDRLSKEKSDLDKMIHSVGIDLLELGAKDDFAEELVHFFNLRKDRVANS